MSRSGDIPTIVAKEFERIREWETLEIYRQRVYLPRTPIFYVTGNVCWQPWSVRIYLVTGIYLVTI